MRSALSALALAVAIGLALSACGSDADSAGAARPAPPLACPPKTLGEGKIAGQNQNPRSEDSIVPGRPDRLLVCRYLGLNHGSRSNTLLSRRMVINPTVVRSIAEEFDRLRRFPKGTFSCLNDDGSRTYVLFHYASEPPVVVEVAFTGCWVASNGHADALAPTARLHSRLESLAPA